jgi:hypothetical protein
MISPRALPIAFAAAALAGCGASTSAEGHAFSQDAKRICEHAQSSIGPYRSGKAWATHAAAVVDSARAKLAALHEPPNVHRALARLELHWSRLVKAMRAGDTTSSNFRAERYQSVLAAHLLDVKKCESVVPKP